jgi:hypothetical protein
MVGCPDSSTHAAWLVKTVLDQGMSQLFGLVKQVSRKGNITYIFFVHLLFSPLLPSQAREGTRAQKWLAEDRINLLPWLANVKVYIYDMSSLGFQSDPDIFRADGPFCGESCAAQFKAPIWGADLCNHGYGQPVQENQTATSLGMLPEKFILRTCSRFCCGEHTQTEQSLHAGNAGRVMNSIERNNSARTALTMLRTLRIVHT